MGSDMRSELVDELPYLRRFARALTGNPAAADDLVQDCLERALGRLHLYDPDYRLRTWLYAILRNLHFSRLRSEAVRGQHVDFSAVPDQELSMDAGQSDRLMMIDLARALDSIPFEQREVLLLVGMEQLSYDEAADVIGAPVGTVMSRLSRGRKRLRDVLDAERATEVTGRDLALVRSAE